MRSFEAMVNFGAIENKAKCINFSGDTYIFLENAHVSAGRDMAIKFIGEKYLVKKDYQSWRPLMKSGCKKGFGKMYYVTL